MGLIVGVGHGQTALHDSNACPMPVILLVVQPHPAAHCNGCPILMLLVLLLLLSKELLDCCLHGPLKLRPLGVVELEVCRHAPPLGLVQSRACAVALHGQAAAIVADAADARGLVVLGCIDGVDLAIVPQQDLTRTGLSGVS